MLNYTSLGRPVHSRVVVAPLTSHAPRQVAREFELEVLREKMEWMRRVEEAEEEQAFLKERAQQHVRPPSARVKLRARGGKGWRRTRRCVSLTEPVGAARHGWLPHSSTESECGVSRSRPLVR